MDETLISAIRERHQHLLDRIAGAAARCGRNPESIKLVVVTKSQPLPVVQAAIAAGARVLGENYAEEAAVKISALKEKYEVEWHMIGHVQSRKAELVVENFTMLHSLDSLKLAARLDRFCGESGITLPVLLEFNISGEESKFGFPAWDARSWPDLLPELEKILRFTHLTVRGLMTMPPYFEDGERSRPYFQCLRRLRDFLEGRLPNANWSELSMGASADFVAAIQEGATFIRVGQAILGPRPA